MRLRVCRLGCFLTRGGALVCAVHVAGAACSSRDVPPSANLELDDAVNDDRDAAAPPPPSNDAGDDATTEPDETDIAAEADAAAQKDASLVDDVEAVCGDALVNRDDESCDGDDLQGLDCERIGYASGTLRCTDDCTWDTRDCVADESCFDARDNDADGLIDCRDEDCAEQCSRSCDEVTDVRDVWQFSVDGPHTVSGNNLGHADELESSCTLESGGREVVYRYVPAETGVVSLRLESAALLALSVRSQCSADPVTATDAGSSTASSELACVPATRQLEVAIEQAQELYLIVEGRRPADEGPYTLFIDERRIVCGDGSRDADEGCDDGNRRDGDGCTRDCELETTEQEPNDQAEDATDFDNPYFASISPSGDVDFIALTLDDEADVLVLSTLSVGDGACAAGLMDTLLEVVDEDGRAVGSDDDGGDGFCSRLTLSDVDAGVYFVSVRALSSSVYTEFPYRLTVVSSRCGDGAREIGEACDDGNRSDGDGCSADCQVEP